MVQALYSIGFTDAMITCSVITILVCVIAIIVSRNLKMIPSGVQNMIEMGIEKLHNFFDGVMGRHLNGRYFGIVATLFIFILICNYTGLLPLAGELPGLQAPTSDINFPAGFAIMVFLLTQILGVREYHGLRTYKRLFKPFAFIFPLLVIDELVRPVSLTFRLYGNTFGDEEAVGVFYDIFPILLPVVIQMLVVLLALIQALVFSLLAATYITESSELEEL